MSINEYGNTIIDNRWMANSQLTADDMGPTAWKQYRQLCDNIAIASWKSLSLADDGNIVGMSLAGLLTFFGSDAKATTDKQKRIMLACVSVKKMQSVDMKKARKALREAKVALDEYDADAEGAAVILADLQAKVDTAQAEVERLESEPMNVWYNKIPMLDSTRKHATAKCRKYIEDTIADILSERELMTIEELQEEAIQLKAARKARKQMKEKQEKAEVSRAAMDEMQERGETPDDKGEAMNLNN